MKNYKVFAAKADSVERVKQIQNSEYIFGKKLHTDFSIVSADSELEAAAEFLQNIKNGLECGEWTAFILDDDGEYHVAGENG